MGKLALWLKFLPPDQKDMISIPGQGQNLAKKLKVEDLGYVFYSMANQEDLNSIPGRDCTWQTTLKVPKCENFIAQIFCIFTP
jgi:hypothetical protein